MPKSDYTTLPSREKSKPKSNTSILSDEVIKSAAKNINDWRENYNKREKSRKETNRRRDVKGMKPQGSKLASIARSFADTAKSRS